MIRRPRVRLIVTGAELAAPGSVRGEHQIYESNSIMLRSLIARDGGQMERPYHVADDAEAIRARLIEPGADVILVSGGSSVGREDHAPALLAQEGELAFHGIAMRPAGPAGVGRLGQAMAFLLPGNPVSCLCAYDFFGGRALRILGGRDRRWPYASRELRVARKIVSGLGRVDYCRIRVTPDGVEPIASGAASILSSITRADGFVIVPEESEGFSPNATVTVYLYEPMS